MFHPFYVYGLVCGYVVYTICVFIVFFSFLFHPKLSYFRQLVPATWYDLTQRIIGYNFLPFVVFSISFFNTFMHKHCMLCILLSHLLILSSSSLSVARFSFVVRHFSLSHFFQLFLLLLSFVFIIYCCLSASSLTIDAEPISHTIICCIAQHCYIDVAFWYATLQL